MALIVQKFGGTSVGTVERIQHVAEHALAAQAQGHQIIVVVSAMSGETNRLVQLATQINPIPYSREYDMLIASGEQIAVGLVSLAINTLAEKKGLIKAGESRSRPLLGHQIGIRTDSVFSKARIEGIDTRLLRDELALGHIPVVAGFQGVDIENNITTLGRGGSDTSAVAIAAAIQADDCEIYTDVDGIYTTDPRMYAGARKISRISYDEMMELASLGAKVLQIRSVELAAKHGVPLHVRSSFSPVEGTRVVSREQLGDHLEKVVVSGVTSDASQVKFTLRGIQDRKGLLADIFGSLSKNAIDVDIIVQDVASNGNLSLSFTVSHTDALKAKKVLESLTPRDLSTVEILEEPGLVKISIVGVGMQNHPGVATKMFSLLSEAGISIKLVTTSEIKISCLIEGTHAKAAVATLHQGFELDRTE
ncbi:MAG: aspartate kinase [Methylotenera sp.]|nr:aspartate kinase [Oligoflexia bacterium]